MIRTLRRRFILWAMLALAILLLVLNCAVFVSSYLRMESGWEETLERLMRDGTERLARPEGFQASAPRDNKGKMTLFGYEIPARGDRDAYYLVRVGSDGGMDVESKGIAEPDEAAVAAAVAEILASGEEQGKADQFKFALQRTEDGGALVALLDNSMPLQSLMVMLRSMLIADLLGLMGMFVILLPLSKRMVRSYARNMEMQRQFITNAGHEIKTPVAIISSNVEAMELIQGENRWSRNIRSQVERLNGLLRDLMELARLDEFRPERRWTRIDLSAMVAEEIEAERERCAQRNVQLRSGIDGGICIRGDERDVRRMVHALVDNAVQYADAGGWIELRLEQVGRRARLTLRNSVAELPPCPPEQLFERFYRGDSARTQGTAGCGVGLSAAQSIVEAHRGRITMLYEEPLTVRVCVELPEARGASVH